MRIINNLLAALAASFSNPYVSRQESTHFQVEEHLHQDNATLLVQVRSTKSVIRDLERLLKSDTYELLANCAKVEGDINFGRHVDSAHHIHGVPQASKMPASDMGGIKVQG